MAKNSHQKRSKYHSRKIIRDGITFDSLKEYRRFCELTLLEKAGSITDLKRQVEFELIPPHFEEIPTGEFYKRGEKKGMPKIKQVCVEQGIKYVADFVYKVPVKSFVVVEFADGTQTSAPHTEYKTIVEDVKGYKKGTAYAVFTIKRKLMLYVHKIKVKEI